MVDGKILVEVKPRRLHNSWTVKTKAEAARKFCREKGWRYVLCDVEPLSQEKIEMMFLTGVIVFLPKYEKKAVELFKKGLENEKSCNS